MSGLACGLPEYDDLFTFLNEPLHERDDPIAMFPLAVQRPDESLLNALLSGLPI